jgi:hypothetical protein
MSLRLHVRAYLSSAAYAAALLFIPVLGPRLFGATLLHLAICVALLAALVLLLTHRKEITDLVVSFLRASAGLLLCLLQPFVSEWFPANAVTLSVDPPRAVLFQRPPPRLA